MMKNDSKLTLILGCLREFFGQQPQNHPIYGWAAPPTWQEAQPL